MFGRNGKKESVLSKEKRVRIMPKAFDCDWRADLLSVGVRIPGNIPTLQYTPVNHEHMPFSLDIDLESKRVVKRTVGVIPNATYRGHIYHWDEFCDLMERENRSEK